MNGPKDDKDDFEGLADEGPEEVDLGPGLPLSRQDILQGVALRLEQPGSLSVGVEAKKDPAET